MKRSVIRVVLFACAAALCLGGLAGCMGGETVQLTQAQQENRAYMQDVNTMMDGIKATASQFAEGVAAGDADEARKGLETVGKALESLKEIKAPDACADIHGHYVAGVEKLKESLSNYYDLVAANIDVQSAAYAEKLAAVQALYNEGVAELKAGDVAAASKE